MLVSTKGRYALRVMLELAQDDSAAYLPCPPLPNGRASLKNIWRASSPCCPRPAWWTAFVARAAATA